MTATAPYLVQTVTDSHGTYEERWMVPPPGDGVTFLVTAEAWATEPCDTCEGRAFNTWTWDDDLGIRHVDSFDCRDCDGGRRRVRVIHEWKAVA